jgi:integrase
MAQANRAPRDGSKITPHLLAVTDQIFSATDASSWKTSARTNGLAAAAGVGSQAMKMTVLGSGGWIPSRMMDGRPLKRRTRDHYTAILDRHLLPTFGRKPVAAITPQDVRQWHARTLTDSPTLRAHAYSLLRTILNSAITDELIDANPCRITGAGRSTRVHRIRPASITELAALTDAMPERLRLMVLLASWCAMRFGEVIELRRNDLDLDDAVIRIRRAAYYMKGGYVAGTPKTDAGIRDVAIPPHLLPVIEEHIDRFVWPQPDALLFRGQNGGRIATSTLQHHWQRHVRQLVARISGSTICVTPARCWPPQPAHRWPN